MSLYANNCNNWATQPRDEERLTVRPSHTRICERGSLLGSRLIDQCTTLIALIGHYI